jgi:tRNA 2-thiouridine synthesizing protein E
VSLHEIAGIEVEINDEGFLVDKDQWTPEMAEVLASNAGIGPLNERHWKVISFCREDTAKVGQVPGLRRTSKMSGVNMKELYELFPKGPGKLAAQVSGLSKPQGCI